MYVSFVWVCVWICVSVFLYVMFFCFCFFLFLLFLTIQDALWSDYDNTFNFDVALPSFIPFSLPTFPLLHCLWFILWLVRKGWSYSLESFPLRFPIVSFRVIITNPFLLLLFCSTHNYSIPRWFVEFFLFTVNNRHWFILNNNNWFGLS